MSEHHPRHPELQGPRPGCLLRTAHRKEEPTDPRLPEVDSPGIDDHAERPFAAEFLRHAATDNSVAQTERFLHEACLADPGIAFDDHYPATAPARRVDIGGYRSEFRLSTDEGRPAPPQPPGWPVKLWPPAPAPGQPGSRPP